MNKDKNEKAYAIIASGGKQYFVREGDTVEVELLDIEQGAQVEFPVLFFNDGSKATVGAPSVSGIFCVAEFLDTTKGPKISSVKYKRSHHQYRKFGHRQQYSLLKIKTIGDKKETSKKH
ncbi:MAG: 50S ribosomal protein L21 [Parachlamydiaceae bacterium]|nr:50S ribosomal protein L21 [Parachlamydiaceae bacterium]